MRRLLVLTVVLLAAPDVRAAVDVRVSGNTVDIRATNTPLSEILDGLARQLKIKIIYEGPPPRQPLTVDLKGRTPAEAFLALVEGQGLTYALAMDKTGSRVETVLMAGGNNAPSAKAGPAPPIRPERPMRESVVAEEPVDDGSDDAEDELPPDTGRPPVPHRQPQQPAEAAPPTQGVYLPAPEGSDFPASAFAPRPPDAAPAAPDKPAPKAEATPPPFNP